MIIKIKTGNVGRLSKQVPRMTIMWKFTDRCIIPLFHEKTHRNIFIQRLGFRSSAGFATSGRIFFSESVEVEFFFGEYQKPEVMAKTPVISRVLLTCVRFYFEIIQLISRKFFRWFYKKPGKSMSPMNDVFLLDSATTLARKIRQKEVTSVQVVNSFIRRIKEVNHAFNCVVDLRFHEALEEARKIDEELSRGKKTEKEIEQETPFLGVPFTFKSCISCQGLRNTAGLYARRKNVASEDADVITLMKQAGAIPLASTNVSELCLWWESYNFLHGRTCNPYNSNHSVGGSSGGEGCIQAFGGSPMGLGSDIGGSIRIPAHFNGIFGHKPTNGYSSVKGHFPFPRYPTLRSFLVIGPMSRFACDLMPMMKVLSRDFIQELRLNETVDIKKLRYFYMDDDGGSVIVSKVDPEIKAIIQKVVKHFKEKHGITVERVNLKRLRYSMLLWFAKMKTKEGPVVAKELANFRGSVNLFWEMLKLLFGATDHTFPVLLTALLEKSGMHYGDSEHSFYVRKCERLKHDFKNLLRENGVFIYPTFTTSAPYHREAIIRPFDIAYTAGFNAIGLPVTHCPMGLNSKGLPIGIQIVAPEKCDRYSIAVAEELERAFGGWVPPPVQKAKTNVRVLCME